MTVGELVYQTAIRDGYNPEEISPELKKIAEVYQRVFDTMREPMKAVSAMAESMQEPGRYPKIGTPFLKSFDNTRVSA